MLAIRFLGDQQVILDGQPLTSSLGRRGVELIAFLASHADRPQARPLLAGQFWPESTGAQSLTNLRRELHLVRSVLGRDGDCLRIDGRSLAWCRGPKVDCDVQKFLSAAEEARIGESTGDVPGFHAGAMAAVNAYRGEFLLGSYEPWVLEERERLHRLCVGLLDGLNRERQHDDIGEALELAERRVQLEPVEETGYQTLMRLQAQAGDRAAAFRTYHRCASQLDRELDLTPSRETLDLYQQLRASSADSDLSKQRERPHRGKRPPLVGRQRELTEVLRYWEKAQSGSAGLLVISGEAGVGKSRMLDEFAARINSSTTTVLRSRCFAGRAQTPLAPAAQWLSSKQMRVRIGRLDPRWRREVERLTQSGSIPAGDHRALVDAWQRHQFFDGLNHAFIDPNTPTALLLDDVHWCDAHTAAWLSQLLAVAQGSPLLVVAAGRSEEMQDHRQLSAMVENLRETDQVWQTPLLPLEKAETARLAEELVGSRLSERDAFQWQESTGGFPLFVVEYARAPDLVSPDVTSVGQPEHIHAILERRLGQLSDRARDVAAMASCVGHEFPLDVLCEASDLSSELVVDAVDELWRRRIFRRVNAQTYDFTHDLLREATYISMDVDKQRLYHRRVAQAAELLNADDLESVANLLADQYGRAGEPKRAIRYHVIAASQAATVFANIEAISHYDKGVELSRELPAGRERDRLELSVRHGMSVPLNAQFGYASAQLRDELERSVELANRLGDDRLSIRSLAGLSAARFVQGDVAASFHIAEQALALGDRCPDDAGQAHFAWAGAATSMGMHEAALPHFDAVHELSIDGPPSVVGTRPEVHGRAWCAHALWLLGREQEALKWSDWAISRAEAAGHPYSLAVALAFAGITHQFRGDQTRAGAMAELTQQVCARYDFAYYGQWGLILQGWCLGGHAGVDLINQGLRALRSQGALVRQPYFLGLLAETLLKMGNVEQAGGVLDAALSAAADHFDRWWVPELWRLKSLTCTGDRAAQMIENSIQVAAEHGSCALRGRTSPARPLG